ncbi:hypothetical protein N665_0101s0019 [Sinapis alba]|nr:hypothetical protein N665_0101s0019 [Sinapis alba]
MPGHIHTGHLIFRRYTQQFHFLEDEEKRSHGCTYPTCDHKYLNKLSSKQFSSTAHKQTVGPSGLLAVDLVQVLFSCEKCSKY